MPPRGTPVDLLRLTEVERADLGAVVVGGTVAELEAELRRIDDAMKAELASA